MSKKVITGIVVVLLFTSVGNLIAQESTDKAPARRRMPAEGGRADRLGFAGWLDDIRGKQQKSLKYDVINDTQID